MDRKPTYNFTQQEIDELNYGHSIHNPLASYYQNPKQHQLKIGFLLNKPNAPLYIFGGIFQTFGVNKETGEKYYNFFETLLQQQQQQPVAIHPEPNQDQLKKEMLTITALNSLLLKKIN